MTTALDLLQESITEPNAVRQPRTALDLLRAEPDLELSSPEVDQPVQPTPQGPSLWQRAKHALRRAVSPLVPEMTDWERASPSLPPRSQWSFRTAATPTNLYNPLTAQAQAEAAFFESITPRKPTPYQMPRTMPLPPRGEPKPPKPWESIVPIPQGADERLAGYIEYFMELPKLPRAVMLAGARQGDLYGALSYLSRKGLLPFDVEKGDAAKAKEAAEYVQQKLNEADPVTLERALGISMGGVKLLTEFMAPAKLAGKGLKALGILGKTGKAATKAEAILHGAGTFGLHEAMQAPREGETVAQRARGVRGSALTGGLFGAGAALPAKARIPAAVGGLMGATYAETGDIDQAIETGILALGLEAFGNVGRIADVVKQRVRNRLAGKAITPARVKAAVNAEELQLRRDITRAKAYKAKHGVFPQDILDKYVLGKQPGTAKGKQARKPIVTPPPKETALDLVRPPKEAKQPAAVAEVPKPHLPKEKPARVTVEPSAKAKTLSEPMTRGEVEAREIGPAEGQLNNAKRLKKLTWKKLKLLREQLKEEPLGGNRHRLELEILRAKEDHQEALRMEREAKKAIAKRKAELGLTAQKPAERTGAEIQEPAMPREKAGKQPWEMSEEEIKAKFPNPLGDDEVREAWMMPAEYWAGYEAAVMQQSPRPPSARAKQWHKDQVRDALVEGKPVPAEVLKDYPNLAKKYGKGPAQLGKKPSVTRQPAKLAKQPQPETAPEVTKPAPVQPPAQLGTEAGATRQPAKLEKTASQVVISESDRRQNEDFARRIEAILSEQQYRGKPAVASYPYIWVRDGLFRYDPLTRRLKLLHPYTKEGIKRAIEDNLDPSGAYSSYNQAAKDLVEKIKAEREERQRQESQAEAEYFAELGRQGEERYRRIQKLQELARSRRFKKQTIALAVPEGEAPLKATGQAYKGLMVHHPEGEGLPEKSRQKWQVTHINSGLRVSPLFDTRKEARMFAIRLADRFDMTRPAEEVKNNQDIAKAIRALAEDVYAELPSIKSVATETQKTSKAKTSPREKPKATKPKKTAAPPSKLVNLRAKGGTTLITDMAEEIAGTVKRATSATWGVTTGGKEVAHRLLGRGTRWMERLGESGKKIADDIRHVDMRAAKRAANNEWDVRKLLHGLNKADRELVAKLINYTAGGKSKRVISKKTLSNIPKAKLERLAKLAAELRDILDRDMNEAAKLGMTRKTSKGRIPVGGRGEAFPQVPNAEGRRVLEEAEIRGLASPRVRETAEKMVENGVAPDINKAHVMLRNYRQAMMRGVNPYFERIRAVLPPSLVEWDPVKVLPKLFMRNAMTVEGVRQWGNNFEALRPLIDQVGTEAGDPAYSYLIDRYIKQNFDVGGMVPKVDSRVAGAISNYETLARLGGSLLSAMRNMGQRFTNTVKYPLSVQLKALKDFPPIANVFMKNAQSLKEKVERTGAVRSATVLSELENIAPGHRITALSMMPFTRVERGNQIHTALMAGYGLERDLELLASLENKGRLRTAIDALLSLGDKSPAAIRRRLKSSALSDMTDEQLIQVLRDNNGKITPQQLQEAMHRLVADAQFPQTLVTKRIWWDSHPWARLLMKFKPFGLEQVGFIYRYVVKEASKGNFAPLVRFVIWTTLMGEIYNILRDNLVGDNESVFFKLKEGSEKKKVIYHLAKDFADGGGVGILADLIWGIGDMLGGPVYSTLKNAGRAVGDIARDPRAKQVIMSLRDFFGREISVSRQLRGFMNRLDRKILNENNRYFEYRKWRQRAYEYKRKDERIADKFNRIIQGKSSFERTEKTSKYEYAARQITAGDLRDAMDYLVLLMEKAETPEERREIMRGLKLSMKAKSPLGPVAKADRREFLSQFSEKERMEARALQNAWEHDYRRAMTAAAKKAWGYVPMVGSRTTRARPRRPSRPRRVRR